VNFEIDLTLLEKLKKDSAPHWGSMTSQHMIEHLTLAVKTSNGKVQINDCMNPPEKYPLLKRILLSSKPLPKNFVNTIIGEELKPLIYPNLENAKEILLKEIIDFENYFIKNPDAQPMNATFGPLNFEEWKIFHNKHFTHHFSQFGLIK
jgi:hypothetical protein